VYIEVKGTSMTNAVKTVLHIAVASSQLCSFCGPISLWDFVSVFFNYHLHIAKQMPTRGGFHYSEDF